VAFVDGDDVYLQSRNGKALRRYFPELRFPKGRYVLDGEIVIFGENGVQLFDALGQRIHPAKTRIDMLAEQTPRGSSRSTSSPARRRVPRPAVRAAPAELERTVDAPVDLTPWSHDPPTPSRGCAAPRASSPRSSPRPYRPGERTGMVKIKRVRTIDAVVRGWRPARRRARSARSSSPSTATTATCARSATRAASRPRRSARSSTASRRTRPACAGPGEPSRWANDRELEWRELRPELVVEVTFDHVSDGRIRHGAKIQRWREDKDPRECRLDQLDS
jgi:ATP-dependent DNA ligase